MDAEHAASAWGKVVNGWNEFDEWIDGFATPDELATLRQTFDAIVSRAPKPDTPPA
jgi:hypothetical protein